MTIILPGGLFAAGISLYLFHQYNRVKEAKQDERRESLNDKRQQYLQQLIDLKRKETDPISDKPANESSREEG